MTDLSDLLQVSISTKGHIPCVEECRKIIAEVSRVEYLVESFIKFQIDADDYLDGINDIEMIDADDYVENLRLWLPSPML